MYLRQRSVLIYEQTNQMQALKMLFTIACRLASPLWTWQQTLRDIIADGTYRYIHSLGQFFNSEM